MKRHAILGLTLLATAPVFAAGPPFADCLYLHGAEFGSCLHAVAKSQQLWAEGQRILQARLEEDPADHYSAFHLARFFMDTGATDQAAQWFERAATGLAEDRDFAFAAYARLNLGECYRLGGRLTAAAQQMDRAVLLAADSGDHELAAQARLRGLRIARSQGRDLEGIRRKLLAMEDDLFAGARGAGQPYAVQKTWLFEMGALLLDLQRLDEAYAVYRRWDLTAEEQGDLRGQSVARVNSATTMSLMTWNRSAYDDALRLANEGLTLAQAAGTVFAADEAHRLLGKLMPGEAGRAHLRRCLAGAPTRSPGRILCHFALAGSLTDEDPDAASTMLDQVLESVAAGEDPWPGIYGWDELFRVVWATRGRERALADSLDLLDRLESLRQMQTSDEGRVEVFAAVTRVYRALTGYLLKLDDPLHLEPSREGLEQAFAVSERMRARVLLDLLSAADASGDDDGFFAGSSEFLGLADLESGLTDHEAAFIFQISPERDVFGRQAGGSWLMVATRHGTRVYRLPDGPRLEGMITMLLGLETEGRDPNLVEEVSLALYRHLLSEAVDDLGPGVDSWVVVPDGLLHLVPFAQLVPEIRLSTVPSLTLWHRWRSAPESAPAAALAFADPQRAGDPNGEPKGATNTAVRRSEPGRAVFLGRLPFARREGRRLVRRLGSPSRLLVDAAASEQAVKSTDLGAYGVLHFATHALLDAQRPQNSSILLAPGSPDEDGLLQPSEIATLDLRGKLLVLSACQSASGKAHHGEGVDSLARAFFRAGARTVVATLWRLRDDYAAAYFETFYQYLGDGETISAAATATARDLRRSGSPPPAWAGVVVLGDGAWAPFPKGSRRRSHRWIVGAAVMALMGVSLALARRIGFGLGP